MNIAFIPIDNRPVCYSLPEQICAMDGNIKFFIPDRDLLGGLEKYANIEGLFEWLKNLPQVDAIIMCLDTIAYGGLIPSRRSIDTFDEIKTRIEKAKQIIQNKNTKVYAFSSIMRISNNNINQEEKEYWNKWGKKIFNYSYCLDKFGTVCKKEVPDEILDDYLETRKRNFEINKLYLEWEKEGFFDTLVFSKDDCAEFGFNVQEAKTLEKLGGFVKTGADEIPMTLLARAILRVRSKEYKRVSYLKVCPIFLVPEHKNLISNYEDVSIEKSVSGQLELAGCEVTNENDADILLYINNFENHQGEIVMKVDTKPFDGIWQIPEKPYMIADVRFANGSDNAFIEKLFQKGFDENFLGYSAWNTSANSLGSLICTSVIMMNRYKNINISFVKQTDKNYSLLTRDYSQKFTQLQLIRFLDDWAYQANVRQMLDEPDEKKVKELMQPFEKKIFEILKVNYNVNYKFPWNRLFEVEIEFN